MRQRIILLLVIVVCFGALPAAAQPPQPGAPDGEATTRQAGGADPADQAGSLQADDASAGEAADRAARRALAESLAAEEGRATYIVQLTSPALPTYTGGIDGLAPTARDDGDDDVELRSAAAQQYRAHLAEERTAALSAAAEALGRTVTPARTFDLAINGFAADMAPDEAAALALLDEVSHVEREQVYELQTDAGPGYISADGIWAGEHAGAPEGGNRGEGVLVGVLDTGISPANPSFAEVGPVDGYEHTWERDSHLGVCDPTYPAHDETFPCNDKLVGAYSFVAGDPNPRDSDGHGSHTASTAAGNVVDIAIGPEGDEQDLRISGVAPRANIVAYRVCAAGCGGAAILSAINQAIADEVDVINYSIGGDAPSTSMWTLADSVAWLNANAAGIAIAHSTGNSGPGDATAGRSSDLPWVTSVGASEHDRAILNTLIDIEGPDGSVDDIVGKGFTGPLAAGTPVVYDTTNPHCYSGGFDADVEGAIVLCDRGGPSPIGRVASSENVAAAGGAGFVLMNPEPQADTVHGDEFAVPGLHVSFASGEVLKALVAEGPVTAGISGYEFAENPLAGQQASFSSRGPSRAAMTMVPRVTAPGLDIIAATGARTTGEPLPVEWGVISGTSMSSPHVAGAYALLTDAREAWSPAEAQSALQLTATDGTAREDGTTGDAHTEGSGYVDVLRAADAGFVLDITAEDFLAANPDLGGDVRQLNYPDMVDFDHAGSSTWTRTLTSTQAADVTWEVTTSGDDAISYAIEPAGPITVPAGGEVEITVTATTEPGTPLGSTLFGRIGFEPDADLPAAHMPVVLTTVAPQSDLEVTPDHVDLVLDEGQQADATLTIANTGNQPLSWSLAESGSGPLWDQPISGTSGIVSDRFLDGAGDPAVFSADDFAVGDGTAVDAIVTPGFWAPTLPGSIADAEQISWYVYPDQDGAPAGHPDDGQDAHVWTFSAAPDAAGVAIADEAVTLDLEGADAPPLELDAGTYWLSVFPDIQRNPDTLNDRWNWYNAALVGESAALTDPSGLFGTPSDDWVPLGDLGVTFDGLAFTLLGQLSCDVPGSAGLEWLQLDPTAGDLAPGASDEAALTVDTTGLANGTYTASLCIGTGDPDVPVETVLVEVEVTDFGSIAGTATDATTGDPIEGATVTAVGPTTASATTGADGTYAISDIPVGEYEVTATAGPYSDASHIVTVTDGATAIADFAMELLPPAVGIAGDTGGQLAAVLDAADIDHAPYAWGDDLTRFTAIVVNRPGDPGEEVFTDFVEATDAMGIGLVLLDTWSTAGNGIWLPHTYLGNPAERGTAFDFEGPSLQYQVTSSHPILGDAAPGDVIPHDLTSGDRDHAWFDGYTGDGVELLADVEVGGEVVGRGIAVQDQGEDRRHVLLSMHAASTFVGPDNWEPASQLAFLRAIDWAEDGEVAAATGPVAAVDPDAVTATAVAGTSTTATLSVVNQGDATLTWSLTTAGSADCDTAPVDWLAADPASGTTPALSSTTVTLTLDAADLAAGTYDAVLCLDSDDGAASPLAVPVTFTVEPSGPEIAVTPAAIDEEVAAGASTEATLTIANPGDEELTWSIGEADAAPEGATQRRTADRGTEIPSQAPAGPPGAGAVLAPAGDGPGGAVLATGPASPERQLDEVTLTHSASQEIVELNSVACGPTGSGTTSENRYLRTFTLDDFDITDDFEVLEVEFGVETAAGPDQPITVNLHLLQGDALVYANLELIGTASTTIAAQEGTYVQVPVTGTAPAGSTLVVEVVSPENTAGAFYIGSNDAGETAPSYLSAPGCSMPEPTTTSAIGFPEMQIVLNVTGEVAGGVCGEPTDVDWLSVDPATGTTEPGGESEVAVTLDAADLEEGSYAATLCVSSDGGSTIPVPVTLEVTEPGPTEPPTEEPTEPPTEEPTTPPVTPPGPPPVPPTEEPTEPPTEEPTEEPTAPPADEPDVPGPIAEAGTTTRLEGPSRIQTAIDIAQDLFPEEGSAPAVVLARADIPADALAGAPLAAAEGGPLLLSFGDELHADTLAEIERVLPEGSTVFVLGGEAALSDAVIAPLDDAYDVQRVAGGSRVETAIAVAEVIGDPGAVLIASAEDANFPDSLTAGAAAAQEDGVVLLSFNDEAHAAVTSYLDGRDADVHAIGGPMVGLFPDADGIAGAGREETARLVAERFFPDDPPMVGLARGDEFADALTGGAHAALRAGPVLLTPSDLLHPEVTAYACGLGGTAAGYVYGGTAALTDAVVEAFGDVVEGSACS